MMRVTFTDPPEYFVQPISKTCSFNALEVKPASARSRYRPEKYYITIISLPVSRQSIRLPKALLFSSSWCKHQVEPSAFIGKHIHKQRKQREGFAIRVRDSVNRHLVGRGYGVALQSQRLIIVLTNSVLNSGVTLVTSPVVTSISCIHQFRFPSDSRWFPCYCEILSLPSLLDQRKIRKFVLKNM